MLGKEGFSLWGVTVPCRETVWVDPDRVISFWGPQSVKPPAPHALSLNCSKQFRCFPKLQKQSGSCCFHSKPQIPWKMGLAVRGWCSHVRPGHGKRFRETRMLPSHQHHAAAPVHKPGCCRPPHTWATGPYGTRLCKTTRGHIKRERKWCDRGTWYKHVVGEAAAGTRRLLFQSKLFFIRSSTL